jgi:hypothetical protein
MALCCLRIFSFLFSWSKDMPITLGDTSITGITTGLNVENTSGDTLSLRKGTTASSVSFGSTTTPQALIEGISGGGFNVYTGTGTWSAPTWTSRMVIDSAGRVKMPNQPAFCAHENGGSSYSNNSTIVFESVKHNVGSHYNSSTGIFTAPVAGRYFFSSQLLGNASGSRAIAYLSVNNTVGSSDQTIEMSAVTTNFQSCQGTSILNLAANDNVRIRTGGGSTNFYEFSSFQNIFCGFLIG